MAEVIRKYDASFQIGLQGPDIFFYDPLSAVCRIHPGSIAHTTGTGTFLKHLLKSPVIFCTKEEQLIAHAYILGFIGHYLLDAACHPYIYARTHYDCPKKEKKSLPYSSYPVPHRLMSVTSGQPYGAVIHRLVLYRCLYRIHPAPARNRGHCQDVLQRTGRCDFCCLKLCFFEHLSQSSPEQTPDLTCDPCHAERDKTALRSEWAEKTAFTQDRIDLSGISRDIPNDPK